MRRAARQTRRVKLRSQWTQLSVLSVWFECKAVKIVLYTTLAKISYKNSCPECLNHTCLAVCLCSRMRVSSLLCRAAAAADVCASVSFMMSISIRCLLNLAAREQSEKPDMTWIITLLRVRLKWSCEWLVYLHIPFEWFTCVFLYSLLGIEFLISSHDNRWIELK